MSRHTRNAIGNVGFSASNLSRRASRELLSRWTSSGRYHQ